MLAGFIGPGFHSAKREIATPYPACRGACHDPHLPLRARGHHSGLCSSWPGSFRLIVCAGNGCSLAGRSFLPQGRGEAWGRSRPGRAVGIQLPALLVTQSGWRGAGASPPGREPNKQGGLALSPARRGLSPSPARPAPGSGQGRPLGTTRRALPAPSPPTRGRSGTGDLSAASLCSRLGTMEMIPRPSSRSVVGSGSLTCCPA